MVIVRPTQQTLYPFCVHPARAHNAPAPTPRFDSKKWELGTSLVCDDVPQYCNFYAVVHAPRGPDATSPLALCMALACIILLLRRAFHLADSRVRWAPEGCGRVGRSPSQELPRHGLPIREGTIEFWGMPGCTKRFGEWEQ